MGVGEVSESYVLRGGDRAADRLRLLAHTMRPTTVAFLQRAGLRPGKRCLDVGCAIGEVTLDLAALVGLHGRAVGIDRDEGAVALARRERPRCTVPAEFRLGDALELAEEAAYDLVYARFLLTHLSDPLQALRRMAAAARPGGALLVEDIDFAGHFCHPECPAFQRYQQLYEAAVRRRGGDARIGPKLLQLFRDAGLSQVEVQVVQPVFHEGEGKRLAAVTLEHIRESVIDLGLTTQGEVDRVLGELEAFRTRPDTLLSLPRIYQVCGWRLAAMRGAPST
jgi:ubiquinone/menaquinone biosynthesis C-methylase UbiE